MGRKGTGQQESADFPNRALAVYALFLAGGDAKSIHTEDVALKCFELAPSSFSWVKYPQYPDKDIARVALTDARKPEHGTLVTGRAGQRRGLSAKTQREPVEDGWMLTPAGIRWIQANAPALEQLGGQPETKTHRQVLLKQLRRIRDHALFVRYGENPSTFTPAIGEVADLLRCRVDAEPSIWKERFEKVSRQAQAAGQEDVLDFISKCHESYLQQN